MKINKTHHIAKVKGKAVLKKNPPIRSIFSRLEEEGIELDSYPTDSFGGSNTGDETLYYYNGDFYEVNKELFYGDSEYPGRTGKMSVNKITDEEQIENLREQYEDDIGYCNDLYTKRIR